MSLTPPMQIWCGFVFHFTFPWMTMSEPMSSLSKVVINHHYSMLMHILHSSRYLAPNPARKNT